MEVLKPKSVLILVDKLNVIYIILHIIIYNCIDIFYTVSKHIFGIPVLYFLAIHQPKDILIYL